MRNFLLLACLMTAVFASGAVRGDVNDDQEVNIADVNAVIEIIFLNLPDMAADVNSDGEINIADVNAIIDIILGDGEEEITPKEIALDYSDLEEPAETIPEDEMASDYGDYVENTAWSTSVHINFDGDTAIVTGGSTSIFVNVSGAHVKVTSATKRVRFIVSGSTSNGSLKIYSERKYQLQLNGVDITNPHGAAINNQCGKSLYLVVNEGTVNTLRDGDTYEMIEGEDQKATVFSEGQILVSGKGQLNIYSTGKSCMTSDDYIFVRPGTRLYCNSTSGHGIKAKDFVYIKGGVINMEIAADGAKGINCDSLVYITGGRTTIINSGTTELSLDSLANVVSTGAAGVKTDWNMTMTGGTLNIKCTGDDAKGLNVTEPLLFSGGELNVVLTGKNATMDPKGVKCDTDCTIRGGSFYSCALQGRAMDVNGTLTVVPGYTVLNDKNYHLFEVKY
ncbi:MAG: carbohydrate-binding domain-containing protein [Muribaculaceae bacterium]|nr:carbohydrate-binding domain-containing protein [Muribaculaceae bacterium]